MLKRFSEGAVQASDGTQIHYRTIGEGTRTVLFMHGWGGRGSGSFWDPVVRRLSLKNLRLVLVDLRGHGHSEHTRHGFTTERFAEDMFNVADQMGATELILVAFSMSGRWAQWMSQSRPERVTGQLLLAPGPAAALPLTEEMLTDWLRGCGTRESFEGFMRPFTKNPLEADTMNDYFDTVRNTPEHTLRETFHMCCQPGFSKELEATRAATLVVGGLHDPMLPPDYLRQEVVERIPGARLALLDCGHELTLELPLETAAIMEAFFAPLAL